jgi:hypothetical protein
MLNSDANRAAVISHFPSLATDNDFEIVRGTNPDYNCIAWAACYDNVWWEPLPENKRPITRFDGVVFDWPFDAPSNSKVETLIGIFKNKRYETCNDGNIENGYRKICFYGNDIDNITHASRQFIGGKYHGKWTSKLGASFEIIHGTPYTIESTEYGNVLQFMKVKFP